MRSGRRRCALFVGYDYERRRNGKKVSSYSTLFSFACLMFLQSELMFIGARVRLRRKNGFEDGGRTVSIHSLREKTRSVFFCSR